MNTEDDGARGDAEQPQPQQPQPNGADHDAGPEGTAATPPPAEPPVEPPPADQPSAEQLGAEATATPGGDAGDAGDAAGGESTTESPTGTTGTTGDAAGADAWEEATAAHEPPGDEPPVGADTGADAGADAGAGASGAAGSGPTTDEYARRFLESVDSFLGNVFREASEFADRTSRRATPPPRADRERPASEDYAARVLDSVEGWMSDFFRGASMARTAAGWGRAATGSAFRGARQRADDVWAQATSGHESDASRECRYCPFCQTMAVVRNSRPELYEQIGDTATRLVDLMRQAAEQSRRRW